MTSHIASATLDHLAPHLRATTVDNAVLKSELDKAQAMNDSTLQATHVLEKEQRYVMTAYMHACMHPAHAY